MVIVLPPSETKARVSRGACLNLDAVSFPELTAPRRSVMSALAQVSAREDALSVLKVGASLDGEVRANLQLADVPTLPAAKLYTGVLFDALEYATLEGTARRRAHQRVVIVSALYGAVRLTDRVAPYRLSGGVKLPGIGDVARFWAPHVAAALSETPGVVVDCRSTTYRPMWAPDAEQGERWVIIDVPGASHWAKHTRGLVARRLCEAPRLDHVEQLPDALGPGFTTTIHRVGEGTRPWIAHVTAARADH